MLYKKHIILGITGGIAAYKSAVLCSLLKQMGAEVRVVMSDNATKFITPLTLETLSGYPVYTDMFASNGNAHEIKHISWSEWADFVIVAPATANILAKVANGIADDALSTLLLATTSPILFAPAMNSKMWNNIVTQENLAKLILRKHLFAMPDSGHLACGQSGTGRMQDPRDIASFVESFFEQNAPLKGKRVLITSGPTREYIDPVRFMSNPSSGKMGKAIAEQAISMGAADVAFVTGPVNEEFLPAPHDNLAIYSIISADDMLKAVESLYQEYDLMIFVAAVSDYKPAQFHTEKIKKESTDMSAIPLVRNPDIASIIGAKKRPEQISIGFAAETNGVEEYAQAKMNSKHFNAIVANNVSDKSIGFGSDDNAVTIYQANGAQPIVINKVDKLLIAKRILECASSLFVK
ncbi:MAG: bifunctional phosphopantothenoylcysteine decarboxylase/phosphopantothenate--cysteine ligase CoaBC [Candidatus Sumerlaeales bacterium]|nr:bifunctional phosphopantothenoylcysteine decarboxylase/phosphopantothenate--cysteine ligase CoaBC [Candidatus Sumerlaeales bacterium]